MAAMSREQMRRKILKHIGVLVEYWKNEARTPILHEKLRGLAFSVLAMIDGEALDIPAGVFHVFRPDRVERIVPDTMPIEERAALEAQGLTLVVVPADDPDHQQKPRAKR